jgi:hypothetical protein
VSDDHDCLLADDFGAGSGLGGARYEDAKVDRGLLESRPKFEDDEELHLAPKVDAKST